MEATWTLTKNSLAQVEEKNFEKNSLFYKVFKARFFSNCSIMEAMESSGGSYAWKSILYGRDVIKKGVRWRICDGCSFKI